jgi:hypothetical protein
MSAVAHGESMGIAHFVGITTGTRQIRYVVGLPAWLAQMCAESIFISTSVAMKGLQRFMLEDSLGGAWVEPHNAALSTMNEVRKATHEVVLRSRSSFNPR